MQHRSNSELLTHRHRALGMGCFAFVAALAFGASESGAQSYAAWSQNKKITLNTTSAGANVTADVNAYPVLVNLTSANFDFTKAKANGEDLRFANEAGTALPYEVETWDATAGKASVWVKTDVKGNNGTQAITLYWGNPAAAAESDGQKVFAAADGFKAVWHLSEKGNTTAGGYKDVTATAANATGFAITGEATGPGRGGNAVLLAHSAAQFVRVPADKSALLALSGAATYSIWSYVKPHQVAYMGIFTKGETGFRIHYYGQSTWGENKGKYITETCFAPGDNCQLKGGNENAGIGTDVAPNKWWNLVALIEPGGVKYYINGVLEVSANASTVPGASTVDIGNNPNVGGRTFDGYLDEARISNVSRSANWIKLDYESQREGSTFLTFGATNSTAVKRPAALAGMPAGSTLLRRYDMSGRLVAEVSASGNAKADRAALDAKTGTGLFLDKVIADNGIATVLKAALPK